MGHALAQALLGDVEGQSAPDAQHADAVPGNDAGILEVDLAGAHGLAADPADRGLEVEVLVFRGLELDLGLLAHEEAVHGGELRIPGLGGEGHDASVLQEDGGAAGAQRLDVRDEGGDGDLLAIVDLAMPFLAVVEFEELVAGHGPGDGLAGLADHRLRRTWRRLGLLATRRQGRTPRRQQEDQAADGHQEPGRDHAPSPRKWCARAHRPSPGLAMKKTGSPSTSFIPGRRRCGS